MKQLTIPPAIQQRLWSTDRAEQRLVPGSLTRLEDKPPVTFVQFALEVWLEHPTAFKGAEALAMAVDLVRKLRPLREAVSGVLNVEDAELRKLLEASKEPPEGMTMRDRIDLHLPFRQVLLDAKDITAVADVPKAAE